MSAIEDRLAKFMADAEALYDRVLAKPWFSYALVSALQMKVLWNIWRNRDLTTGDTTSYFRDAYRWYETLEVNIVWSPLYTAFYGTVYAATQDVYVATIFHRVIIVMVATLGILALMRRLLPSALALIVAVWWALLPIIFETLYEVHLFALLPILAAWLVVSRRDTAWRRGTALGILLATTVLVRNETIVAWGLYAVICLVREVREHSRGEVAERRFWHSRAAAYGIPAIVAIGTCAAFYWRSHVKYPEMMAALHAKHSLNMCQVFAFSYSQRHPDWTLSPWVECGGLAKSQFGYAWPTVAQMITNNPAAALEHFLWNVSLTLNGFQVGLFNAMSGTVNPDYAPVRTTPAALLLSILAITMVAAAAVKVFRNWADWRPWFNERRGLWLIMFAVMCVAVPTIITQRPRPSYLFASTAVLMAVIGTAAHVLCPRGMRVTSKFLAVVVVPILVLAIPSHYSKRSERLLYTGYERLLPFRDLLAQPKNRILLGDYSGEYAGYLRLRTRNTLDYGVLQSWKALQPLNEFLDFQGINILFVQPRIMPELRARSDAQLFLERPEAAGWQRVAPPPDGFSKWILLYKAPH